MKTAVQLLQEWVEDECITTDMGHAVKMDIMRAKLTELLEVERGQLRSAYAAGDNDTHCDSDGHKVYTTDFETYYTTTFKNKGV